MSDNTKDKVNKEAAGKAQVNAANYIYPHYASGSNPPSPGPGFNPSCGPGTNPLQTPYPGYPCVNFKYWPTSMYVAQYQYPEALRLIVESVSGEREDELFYSYMLNIAPPGQKEIIAAIRDDEIKHNKMLRELYWQLTGQELPPAQNGTFQPPQSYCAGITQALFGELAAVERYRKILFGLEFLPYRNMIIEIYTDELKHGSKWNYLFAVNCANCKNY